MDIDFWFNTIRCPESMKCNPKDSHCDCYQAEQVAKEVIKLREALAFYANRKHYDLFVRSHSSMGEYETSFIQDDGGQIAREALGEK